VGPPNKIRRKAMIRGKTIFRKEKGRLTTNVVAAVMRQTMSSLHGTDNKIMKQFALKMHP
jgi:hypothetical protein